MVKRILGFLMVVVVLVSLFAGCGSKSATSDSAAGPVSGKSGAAMEAPVNETANGSTGAQESGNKADAKDTAVFTTGTESSSVVNAILAQRKVIRNANVSLEVENYEKVYWKIEAMVEGTGFGYIQKSSISTREIYVNSIRKLLKSGIIIVRVDAEKYTEVLRGVKGLGEVLDATEDADDVTDKYYDVESELRLLRYEQSRLEQYLNKISDPDTIFKTESRLTDIRHQIEGLTGTLNKLDNLVKLSTITININEKDPVQPPVAVKEKTYLEKLTSGFTGSLKGVIDFCGSLFLFLMQALPVLVLLALLAWLAFVIYKWVSKRYYKREPKHNKDNDNSTSI